MMIQKQYRRRLGRLTVPFGLFMLFMMLYIIFLCFDDDEEEGGVTIPRIHKDYYPSANIIRQILISEQQKLHAVSGGAANNNNMSQSTLDNIKDMAKFYELTYAFVAAFQRGGVPILAGMGSHLGARRHHAIIPFGEKDVDFEVFSLNETKVFSIINETLQSKTAWSNIIPRESDFGYQLGHTTMKENGFPHYIDFWLFDDKFDGDKIKCTGRVVNIGDEGDDGQRYTTTTGCDNWYSHYNARPPPTFERSDHLPPVYQVFGTHRVPIPRTSAELETWEYAGGIEDWNTTCGVHQRWDDNFLVWVPVPKEERDCRTLFYNKYPFVFKMGDGREELRQGDIVIHTSEILP